MTKCLLFFIIQAMEGPESLKFTEKTGKTEDDYFQLIAGENDNDRRIDRIIRKILPELSLSKVYSSIRKGLIRINGGKVSEKKRVKKDDKISVHKSLYYPYTAGPVTSESIGRIKPPALQMDKINVIFENEFILAVDKPPGIPVQDSRKPGSELISWLKEYVNNTRPEEGLSFTPGPLNRIDKETSGLVFFSGNLYGAREFSEWIRLHLCRKFYLAIVSGIFDLKKEWKKWEDKLLKVPNNPKVQVSEKGLYACSFVKPLAVCSEKNISLLLVSIKTGRTHQIRVQCGERQHHIIGDKIYGGASTQLQCKNLFLHSWMMGFPPEKRKYLNLPEFLSAQIPDYFAMEIENNFGKEMLAWIINQPYNEIINGFNTYYI